MANTDARIGLRPVQHRNGAPYNGAVRPYYIPAAYGTALFIGDPVIITGTANTANVSAVGAGEFQIGTLPEINKATMGDGNRITGVIVRFAALPTGLENRHNPASTERVAWVCDDPDVIFEIQADGAVAATDIGANANLIATHAGDTVSGLSGVELNSAAMAADASNQLLIVAQVNREDNEPNVIHNNVLVLINQHTMNPGAAGALGI